MRRVNVVNVSVKMARALIHQRPGLRRSRRNSASTSPVTWAFTNAKAKPSETVASSVQARKIRFVSDDDRRIGRGPDYALPGGPAPAEHGRNDSKRHTGGKTRARPFGACRAGERLSLQGILPDGSHRTRGEVSGVHHL